MPYDSRQAIEELDRKISVLIEQVSEIRENHLPHIDAELQRLGGRPSWIVLGAITFLSSLCSVLLTIILK